MFEHIKNFINQDDDKNKTKPDQNTIMSSSLKDNLIYFRKEFDESADLTIREIDITGTNAAIITIEGMIDKEVLASSVVNPILNSNYKGKDIFEKYKNLRDSILSTSEQIQVITYQEAFKLVMSGFVLIAIDGLKYMLAIGIQGFSFRGIEEPTSEVMQTGSREGLVEALRINMTMIRRRIKNPKLKFEMLSLGGLSNTDVCLCYINDLVSPSILRHVKNKLHKVDLNTLLESGYLIPYLEEKKDLSLFNSVGTSERPDTICAKISEGRIAILVDGTPNAIIVPYLFVEYFQTLDDYSQRPYFATLTRWLKYFSFFIATLFPGIYVATATFHPEFFPVELLNKIAKSVATTPFPLMIETLVIHFVYEIMREAGLRLPRTLGHAVSIVGALVIGETAVNAGLIGGPTLMVVAITAISSYVIPSIYEPTAILRILFIIIGGIMGIWGVMLLFCAVLINICAKTNYGIPFLAPISPFNLFGMRDVLIRAGWKVLSKKNNTIQSMPGTNSEVE